MRHRRQTERHHAELVRNLRRDVARLRHERQGDADRHSKAMHDLLEQTQHCSEIMARIAPVILEPEWDDSTFTWVYTLHGAKGYTMQYRVSEEAAKRLSPVAAYQIAQEQMEWRYWRHLLGSADQS